MNPTDSSCCSEGKGGWDKYVGKHLNWSLSLLHAAHLFQLLLDGKTVCVLNPENQTSELRWWDGRMGPPCSCLISCSHSFLLISSCPPLFILQLQSLSLCHRKFLSSAVCPRDTKMDGEAPGTMACATRWAGSAAYGPEHFFLTAARLLLWLQKKCVRRRRRRVWAAQYGNRCFCSAKSLKGGLGWGA